MKKIHNLLVIILLFFSFIPSPLSADNLNAQVLLEDKMFMHINMDLAGTSLREVLKMLSVQTGLNFISSETVGNKKVTLFLEDVVLKDALDKIFKANNLKYEIDPESNIFMVKDLGAPDVETETRVYFLKYASATNSRTASGIGSLKDAVMNALSSNGKIVEDAATNSMIITDATSRFFLIEQIIDKLDVPVPQVMIEVEILDVDKSDVDTLGFKFSGSNWISYAGPNMGQTYFPLVSDFFRKTVTPRTPPTPASWTMANFSFVFDFLSTRSSTKFLARPKIFVLNNETAELKLSANEAVGKVTTQATATTAATESAERAETGVTLKVTPQISMATGEITMVLEPSIKETVSGLEVGGQTTKDIEERSLKSTVRILDGQTVILGGLIRRKDQTTLTNVPFFSQIPILGMLFRHRDHSPQKDREILVFITPRIMKNPAEINAGGVARKVNFPVRPLGAREQETIVDPKRRELVSKVLGMYE